jgi:TDG/mug DNA glycosylase family protein
MTPTQSPVILDDMLAPGLRIVLCGTAPGRVSARQQAYYAHPQNKFWRILHETGLTPQRLRPEEYRELLSLGIGLTDIAKQAFGMDNQLPRGSLGREATAALRAKIELYQPGIVAFTSLNGGTRFLRRAVKAGPQPETIGSTRVWILPSPAPTANWNWNPQPWFDLAAEAALSRSLPGLLPTHER